MNIIIFADVRGVKSADVRAATVVAMNTNDGTEMPNAKLSRWSIALQPFKFQVRHRPGKVNGNADTDCLS